MNKENNEKDYIIKNKRFSEETKKVRHENIIPPNNPTATMLRELNPLLDRFSDIEIGDFVDFLTQNGFIWHDAEKTFYHDKLQFSMRTQGLDLFVNDRNTLEDIITARQNMHSKYPNEYNEITAEIGIWNKMQRSAMLFGVLGLFFGWIIFKWKMWLFYECFCLISVLVSVRIQGMLLRKLDKLEMSARNANTKTRILLVDDEPDLIEFLKTSLMQLGFEISTAVNGRDALTMIKQNDYDILISNINMPEINGIELLKEISEVKKDLIKIILTGDDRHAETARKYGCFSYLKKPVNLNILEDVISHALRYKNESKG